MPNLDSFLESQNLSRTLAYGPPKCRKTWWAATAAEAGYNVLLLGGDKNYGVLRLLSPEARKRIFLIDWSDSPTEATFAKLLTLFLSSHVPLYWNEATRQRTFTPAVGDVVLSKTLLDSNWVLILDTYTALSWSYLMQFCIENSETMVNIQKPGSKLMRESYRYTGVLATWAIQELKKLPCHLIVVAHQDTYEKRNKKEEVILSRIQVKSTSGPHAMQVAKDFTDVFFFSINGQSVNIDTNAAVFRDGGSTSIQPGIYSWDALSFKAFAEQAAFPPPKPDLPYPSETLILTEETRASVSQKSSNLLKSTATQGGNSKAQIVLPTKPATITLPTKPASPLDILSKKL